jgi:plasmid stabilization system protein ParE
MSLQRILLTPSALEDLQNTWDYLNEQRSSLGDEFVDEFIKITDLLLEFPELYPEVRGDIRRGIIRKFRYIFTYTIQGDAIVVARIMFSRRNTEYY